MAVFIALLNREEVELYILRRPECVLEDPVSMVVGFTLDCKLAWPKKRHGPGWPWRADAPHMGRKKCPGHSLSGRPWRVALLAGRGNRGIAAAY